MLLGREIPAKFNLPHRLTIEVLVANPCLVQVGKAFLIDSEVHKFEVVGDVDERVLFW